MKEGIYLVNGTDIIFNLVKYKCTDKQDSWLATSLDPIKYSKAICAAIDNGDCFYIGEVGNEEQI